MRQLIKRARFLPYAVALSAEPTRINWFVDNDVKRFREAVASRDWPAAIARHGGDLLEGVTVQNAEAFGAWLELERDGLRTSWREAALQCVQALGLTQRHAEAAALSKRVWQTDRLDEQALRAYMTSAAMAGEPEGALLTYQGFQRHLSDEMGMRPLEATQDLAEDIRSGATVTPELGSREPRVDLPTTATPFVGRRDELGPLLALTRDESCRLIAVTGPGGIGKTRLAVEAAAKAAQDFGNGVCFVPLAGVSSTDFIVPTIAKAESQLDSDLVMACVGPLAGYYIARGGFHEGQQLSGAAAAALVGCPQGVAGKDSLNAQLLKYEGAFAHRLGRYEAGLDRMNRSLLLFQQWGLAGDAAFCWHKIGLTLIAQGNYDDAKAVLGDSLAAAKRACDVSGSSDALNALGIVYVYLGELEAARRLSEENLAIRRNMGRPDLIASCLNNLGMVASALGEHDEAARLFEESLRICREIDDAYGVAVALNNLGDAGREFGESERALALAQQSLALRRNIGDSWGIASSLFKLGLAHLALGDYQAAKRHYRDGCKLAMDIQAPSMGLEIAVWLAEVLMLQGNGRSALAPLLAAGEHPARNNETKPVQTRSETTEPIRTIASGLRLNGRREAGHNAGNVQMVRVRSGNMPPLFDMAGRSRSCPAAGVVSFTCGARSDPVQ